MRRYLAIVPCFLVLISASGRASAADTTTTVLGLLSTEQTASFAEEFSSYMRDAVAARPKLGHTGKDQTLEQVAMAFGCLESLDPMCLADIGSSLETGNLIYGKVDATGGDDPGYKVTITLFDVTGGKVLKTTSATIAEDKQGSIYLQEASDRIVAELFGEEPETTIIVQSNVAGAAILLDGVKVGKTGSEPFWLREVEPGEHVVKVEKEKFESFEKEIDIEKGSRMDIDAPLYIAGEKPPVEGGGNGGGVTPVGGGPKVDKDKKKNKNKVKMGVGAGVSAVGLGLVGAGIGMTTKVAGANDDLAEARSFTLRGQDVCACFNKDLPTADCFGSSAWPSGVDQNKVKDACSSGKMGQTAQFVFYGVGAAALGVGLYLLIDSIVKEKQGPKSETKVKKAKEEEDLDEGEDVEEEGGGEYEEDEEYEEEDARIQIVPFFTADGGFLSVVGHF